MAQNRPAKNSFPDDMTMDQASWPEGFDYTPEIYAALALYAKSKPNLNRTVTNVDKFWETLVDHNKPLRDMAIKEIDKVKPQLAAYLHENWLKDGARKQT